MAVMTAEVATAAVMAAIDSRAVMEEIDSRAATVVAMVAEVDTEDAVADMVAVAAVVVEAMVAAPA